MTLLGRRGAALYVMTVAYLLGYLLIGFAVNVEMIIIGNYDKILMITHISPPTDLLKEQRPNLMNNLDVSTDCVLLSPVAL